LSCWFLCSNFWIC